MKHILVLGAGKSATALIEYLISELPANQWQLTVADANIHLAILKTNNAPYTKAVGLNVEDASQRKALIAVADLVISLLPPTLHYLVAQDCLANNKHLLTASYIDDKIAALAPEINDKGLLFLCEMGLDPGIDHMSAMQLIHRIKDGGGKITSFMSHCGGLVAPENDDNPWHYKISWNPRNVVLAGKSGAIFKENGEIRELPYHDLFDANRIINIPELGNLAWYPNRDSLSYVKTYDLDEAVTFIRTTLRYPEFCFGWKNVIDLKLTDEEPLYDTNGMTLQSFFHTHFTHHRFSDWLEKQLTSRFAQTRQLLEKLRHLLEAEQTANEEERKALQDFMMVDNEGKLTDVNLDSVKNQAAATVAGQMHEANLSMKQLFYLGMDDTETTIDKGLCSAADIMTMVLEKKLPLRINEKDMVVMQHEIEYEIDNTKEKIISSLIVKGEDSVHTAMAKTVGLPLGIAARLVMQGKINLRGLHIPISAQLYEPVLAELELHGIRFHEH